jgi:hypothetical protein
VYHNYLLEPNYVAPHYLEVVRRFRGLCCGGTNSLAFVPTAMNCLKLLAQSQELHPTTPYNALQCHQIRGVTHQIRGVLPEPLFWFSLHQNFCRLQFATCSATHSTR